MALSQGSLSQWADITTIYSNLNTNHAASGKWGRSDFGFGNVTVPSNKGVALSPSHVSLLSSFISGMASNAFLASIAKGVTTPGSGVAASFTFMATLNSQVNSINGTCPNDTSNRSWTEFTSNRSGYNGSNFTSNRSWSNFTTNRSWTDFSGNRSWGDFSGNRSGNFGSCNGYHGNFF